MSQLRTVLFTDAVGSTARKGRLGDHAAGAMIAGADALFRKCLARTGGFEVDTAGDGFFCLFDDPAQAVRCALEFHSALSAQPAREPLGVRIGIHRGPVSRIDGGGSGEGRDKYYGLAVDTAYRVMELAAGGQIFATREIFDSVRAAEPEPGEAGAIAWHAHGRFHLKNVAEPLEIFQAGAADSADFSPPAAGDGARAEDSADARETPGWRPAAGQEIPNRPGWRLERMLGRGAFAEVWLARDGETGQRRAFKFCFDQTRLRNLRREFTVFRLLRDVLGERPDIACLQQIELSEPPFYIEMEYAAGGDLGQWADELGGIARVPLGVRLEIAAQVADALSAAHSVGVIHKDVKPRNVLMSSPEAGRPSARLGDFGIGRLSEEGVLTEAGIVPSGFTATFDTQRIASSRDAGTFLYMAPEVQAGAPATTRSDTYSLGVLLYQLVVGDFSAPLGPGWERNIEDELLRGDIAACVDVDPAQRLADPSLLAAKLRTLPERRSELARARAAEAAERLARRRRKLLAAGAAAAAGLSVILGAVAFWEFRRAGKEAKLRRETETALASARYELYASGLQFAQTSIDAGRTLQASERLYGLPEGLRGWEWGFLLNLAHKEIAVLEGHSGNARGAWFSLDGRWIVSVSDDKTARIWDALTANSAAVLSGHAERVLFASFSPDSRRVVTASDDATARCWSLDGRELFVLRHERPVNKALFGPRGDFIVTVSDDGTAKIWNAGDGSLAHDLRGHQQPIFGAAVAADGRRVATAGDDGTARIWDAQTGRELLAFRNHSGPVNSVEFDPSGERVLTASDDKTFRLWDARTGAELREPIQSVFPGRLARFSSDGAKFVTVAGSSAIAWDSASGESLQSVSHAASHSIEDAHFISGGSTLLTAGKDAMARLTWLPPEKTRETIPIGAFANSCSASPDGALAVVASADGSLRIVSPAQFFWTGAGHDRPVQAAALDQTGAQLASGDDLGYVCIFEGVLNSPRLRWRGHQDRVYDLQFSPDGARLAGASMDKTARIWDSRTGREIRRLEGHGAVVRSVRFSPDGRQLLTAAEDGSARVWDLELGAVVRELRSPKGWVYAAEFSPDGRRAVTAHEDGARVWNLADGALLLILGGRSAPVSVARHSPDGKLIVTCAEDGSAEIHDAETGRRLFVLRGHSGAITDAAFTPDSRRILTSGASDLAAIWDAGTGRELLRTKFGPVAEALSIRLAGDGTRLAVPDFKTALQVAAAPPLAILRADGGGASPKDRFHQWRRSKYAQIRAAEREREARTNEADAESPAAGRD